MSLPPVLPPRGPAGGTAAPASLAPSSSNQAASTGKQSPSNVKPLEGTTTIDDKLSIECDILCYASVNNIAFQIALEFNKIRESGALVIILDDTSKQALHLVRVLVWQTDFLIQEFARAAQEAAPQVPALAEAAAPQVRVPMEGETMLEGFVPALPAVTAIKTAATAATDVGRSVIDLLSLFRTDTSYAGRTVTVNENSLMLSLAGKLVERQHSVIYPKLLLFPPSPAVSQSAKDFQNLLQALLDARDDANEAVRALASRVAVATQELSSVYKKHTHRRNRQELTTDHVLASREQQLIKDRLQLAGWQKWFTDLDSQLQALLKALNAPDANGVVLLQMLQIAQELLSRFNEAPENTYFLHAEVVSSGGSYRIRRNLFRTLFWSDGLSYSGGAIVSYAFFDSNAVIVKSGTHHYRYPFSRFRDAWWSKKLGNSFQEGQLSKSANNSKDKKGDQLTHKDEGKKNKNNVPMSSAAVLENKQVPQSSSKGKRLKDKDDNAE